MEKKDSRLFIASSELFSNFEVEISLDEVSSLEGIVDIFKKELHDVLENSNLINLIKKLEESNFHIHSFTIEDILVSNSEDIFYICDHC